MATYITHLCTLIMILQRYETQGLELKTCDNNASVGKDWVPHTTQISCECPALQHECTDSGCTDSRPDALSQ